MKNFDTNPPMKTTSLLQPWLKFFAVLLLCINSTLGIGQIVISNATPSTQNFDGMNATLNLPTDWRIRQSNASPTWAAGVTATTQQASSGSPATGGTYNWGSSASERAVGALTSSGFASPNNLMSFYVNSGASNITNLSISYKAERYRINTAAASVQFFYSLDGTAWTAVSAGDIAASSFPTGASSYTFATPLTITVSAFNIPALTITPTSNFYLRWNINTTGTNSQGIGIDDVSVTATYSVASAPTKLVITNISPASPTVGSGFNVTVQAQDASNVPQNVTSATDATLTLNTGTGALSGTLVNTIANGTSSIVISGVNYNVAEAGVVLTASATSGMSLTAGNSAAFTVLAAANQLAFSGFPATGTSGINISSFTVQALRPDLTVDNTFTGTVTLSKASGPGNLAGTVSAACVAGVATFNAVQFDAGGAYILNANSGALTMATSSTINITGVASIAENIFPQYAINGNTAGERLPYVCRLTLSGLTPSATYRYFTGASTNASLGLSIAPGNFYAINNTAGGNGYIVGQSSNKSFAGTLIGGDEFTASGRYAEFSTDGSGNYTGWFSMVPTGNAVFADGNNVYLYLQLNDGAGGTVMSQSIRTTNTISMIAASTSGRAVRGTSLGTAENMVFLYGNTAGTGRPVWGSWIESDGITPTYTTWYNGSVDAITGSWGAYIPSAFASGVQRVESRDVATAAVTACPGTSATGVWSGAGNTVNPTAGTTPIVFSTADASFANSTWYADVDGDGYGAGAAILACIQPVNTSTNNTDCNDAVAAINPGATEICNGIDDDCDGLTDELGGTVHNVTANTFHCTIQGAITAATAGDVINVPAGTYAENVIVNKSVTLNGPNAAVDACTGTRVAEAIIVPSISSIDLGEIFHIAASNVTISGFTIDGDNTAITSGFTSTNGADIDAAEGVTVYETGVNNLTVSNNIIQNLSYFGVTLYDYPAAVPSSGHSIANNKIQNLGTYDATSLIDYWGGGVLLYNNQYAAITNNCMTNVRLGLQTGNFHQANPGAAPSQVISGNTIQARRTGVFHNLHYSAASALTFSGNTITALANANETRWDGIALSSLSVPSVSTNNIINGNGIVYTNLTKGYELWNVKTPLTASTITGGSVSGVDIGVFANNYDGYSSDAPDGAHATLSGVTITPNATGVGIRVYDNALATSHGAVRLDVSGCTISGGLEGIKFEETLAGTVGGTINNNNIGATAVGVNVTSMVTSASNVFSLTNNTINITTQVAGPNPTTGVLLRKVTGTTAAAISGNNITGPFIGYLAYNLNTTPASDIDGGTITGVLQGVSFLNIDPLTFTAFAPSNTTVKNVSMNGFTGNHPSLPNNNFHAGVYSFTTGSDLSATLNVTLRDLTIDGTGKISGASGAIVPADFSTGAGVRQTITVDSCTLTNNLNRAISVRGKNAIVDVNNSTLTNNGGDPFGAGGNDGFGIIAREGSVVTVDNNFITNPSSNVGFTVTALATDLGTSPTVSLTATNNSINNNGNTSGYLARNFGGTLTATCNWWGTGNLATIASLMSGAVTYQPMLIGGTDGDVVMDGFQPAAICQTVLAVTVTGTVVDETCTNLDNGSIDITAANGIAPYTYLWSNASTTEDQTGLDAGTYTVTVTDAYGNSGTNSFVVNPGATPTTWYADVDGDGYGAGAAILACIQPVNTSTNNTDCNDAVAAINPGATETCNGIDDDCDGLTDELGGTVHNVTANTFHCTIQGAINAATAGDVINVPAGTYAENVIVNKSLTILGPNAAVDACTGTRVAEAIIVPSISSIDLGEIFHIAASNVTISGFTIDGDNTSITSGFTSTNGADIDAAEGVTVYETGVNNLTVSNNIIQNLSYFGVTLYDYPAAVPSSGHSIANNKIQNLGTYDATSLIDYWGGGVLLYNNQYAAITNNCMTNVRLGLQTGNFHQANPGAAPSQVISGNTIQARRTGVFHNLHYSAASALTFSGNTITALANANETRWDGIALSSLSVPSVSTNNIINGNGIVYTNLTKGYELWNVKTPLTASSITGGSVSGVDIGVFANNYDGYSSDAPDGAHATLSGVTITPNATGVGIRVYDNALATSHGAVRLDVSGCTISGGLEGIKFEETLAGTVSGTINNNNIGATAVGVNVTSMVTSASNVFSLTNNTINITTQVAGPNPTTGVLLRKVTGTTAAAISGNNITGPFIGYLAYNLNTTPASDIDGGTITGVLQGVSFLNIDPLTFTAFAPSNTTVKNVSMNGFTGNHPSLPNNNFHAGVYSFTTGSDLSATLNVTLRDLTIDGTGKISGASGAIVPADFSTGAGVRQTITVDSCTLTNNLNRAITVRGKNSVVDINNSTLTNNGGDPFGAGGNDGFGIIAREGSVVTVDNNFITNPSSNVGFTVTALATDLGTSPTVSLTATNNSINNNGNTSGYLARNFGGTLTATCNWWGTGNLSTIASLMSGAVTYQPMLTGGADNDVVMDGFQPAASCEMVLAVSVTGTATDETCTNLDNGSIDITAANGIAPYTYLWSNASTNEDQTGLDAGTYTVTVTDAYGNSGTNSFVVNPGATPTTWYADVDGDTYGDAGSSVLACIQPVGYVADNTDCNDNNAAINPAAQEICDGGIDNDCDGLADDADPSVIGQGTYYADVDGDGYGAGAVILACIQPVNTSTNNTDCNDAVAAINPAAQEICDGGIDNDCDGLADDADPSVIGQGTYYADIDGDGYGAGAAILACVQPVNTSTNNTDCNDAVAAINPGAQEICDGGIDNDCDGLADDADPSVIGQITWYADVDGDGYGNLATATLTCNQPMGYILDNSDCNDAVAAINPGATEVCNGIDDDCDGDIDDDDQNVVGQSTWYADADGDTYGDAGVSTTSCNQPIGYVSNNTDCDDADISINPGATESCNGVDDDCNGLIDDNLTFITYYNDFDGDGYGAGAGVSLCSNPGAGYALVNADCNDAVAAINPGAQEICDGGIDNDCDGLADDADPSVIGQITWYADVDGDGYGNLATATLTCNQPMGYILDNSDCNDAVAAINPGATEVCNGIDDDCDGDIDDDDQNVVGQSTWYADADGDTYGDAGVSTTSCNQPIGYVSNNTDCDDADISINPGATEACNGVDDDCNGLIDDNLTFITYYNDFDGDGYGVGAGTSFCTNPGAGYALVSGDCNDAVAAINPGAQEICDGGIDNDCDGLADDADPSVIGQGTYYADVDGDGYGAGVAILACIQPVNTSTNNTDCNDAVAAINPGAQEICDGGIDNDCDGLADDADPSVIGQGTYYADVDGDGYGAGAAILACIQPVNTSTNNTDCNDAVAAINPAAQEICDGGIDNDCDGLADDADPSVMGQGTYYTDADGDGYGTGAAILACIQPVNTSTNNTDCNDAVAAINPGAQEICDGGIDNDCDGLADDADPSVIGQGTYYADVDGDGYGAGAAILACIQPVNTSTNNTDCNDAVAAINPGAQEICDGGIDNDCDGLADDADPSVIGQGTYYADVDGDGYGAGAAILACIQPVNTSTNNTDCNDAVAAINPGAQEICDGGIDNDCDGLADDADPSVIGQGTYYADVDGDGYGAGAAILACIQPVNTSTNNTDCNDAVAAINPGAQEICDGGIDNDCDGLADDADPSVIGQGTYYTDADGDGYGTGAAILACIQPVNTSTNNTDCNDAVAAINPGAQEICDGGIDNDCDGLADDADPSVIGQGTYYADVDGDGYGAGAAILACIQPVNTSTNNTDCNDAVAAINPGAQEICDGGIDNDCDGLADDADPSVIGQGTYYADVDGDGYGAGAAILACIQPVNTSTNNTDCNDAVAAINPAAQEICDGGIDNDCDGLADDADPSVIGQGTYYTDADGDGYGAGAAIIACIQPVNTSTNNTDCNDAVAAINPGAQEICDGGIDNDCDGLADDADPSVIGQGTYYTDADGDGYGTGAAIIACIQPVNTSTNNTDCNDAVAAINPGAQEICDGGIDNDCDGLADDADPSVIGQGTYYTDADGDGYGAGAAILACIQPVNTSTNNLDCNDGNLLINPAAQEICDGGIDNDCNGLADDADPSIVGQGIYFADNDGDGYGAGATILACIQPIGTSTNNTDCNDGNAAVNPGATEVCNGIDDNCDGLIDNTIVPSLGTINGPLQQCLPISSGSATFSVVAVPGVLTYTWTVPVGLTIVSGQGTTTLNVSWTSAASHTGIVGPITVTPNDACFSGTPSSGLVDINYTAPVRPPSISGAAKVCPGDVVVYSIANVARASSYLWTVPAGVNITSGQGTNIITATITGAFAGGVIEVVGVNVCGASPSRTKTMNFNIPGVPSPISGITTGLCSVTGNVFSTAGATAATSYVWSTPPGVTITSGQGTNTITVNINGSFTTGSVFVSGVNGCGTGSSRSVTITGNPGIAGLISGPTTVCPGATGIVYQVATVGGANNYTWTVPNSATITSGQGTKIITVDFSLSSANNQTVSVRTDNACGQSPLRSLSGISINNIYCGPRLAGENSSITQVIVFPNPATDLVTIQFNAANESNYRLRLTDMLGREIFVKEGTTSEGKNTMQLGLETLNGGVYFVEIQSGEGSQSIRLMVE